jgi:hypothetical protein
MKAIISSAVAAVLLAALPLSATADPAAFVGVTYSFGGNFGVTAKVLSSDHEDNGVLAVGATWYPGAAKQFGLDVSAGYAGDNAAALIGWDFLQQKAQFSAGWADTDDDDDKAVGGGSGTF